MSPRWNSRAFGFPALSVDLRRVDRFPAQRYRRSSGYLSFPRFRRSARSSPDLPRLRSPAFFTLELHYFGVLLRHSIGAIASLDRSCIECLRESLCENRCKNKKIGSCNAWTPLILLWLIFLDHILNYTYLRLT